MMYPAPPTVSRGFREAWDDLKPVRKWVVYPGAEPFPIASGVEAISLSAALDRLKNDG